jgi:hypothetical protein
LYDSLIPAYQRFERGISACLGLMDYGFAATKCIGKTWVGIRRSYHGSWTVGEAYSGDF